MVLLEQVKPCWHEHSQMKLMLSLCSISLMKQCLNGAVRLKAILQNFLKTQKNIRDLSFLSTNLMHWQGKEKWVMGARMARKQDS